MVRFTRKLAARLHDHLVWRPSCATRRTLVLGLGQLWLVLLVQAVHLHVRPTLAAALAAAVAIAAAAKPGAANIPGRVCGHDCDQWLEADDVVC